MAIDWLGIIGAAAWLVPIIGWIKKSVTKPEIQIFTAPAPEIGFTMNGPIFNIRMALAVRYKEIVVTRIGIRLTHESGSFHKFEWRGMTQTMGQMRSPQGHIPFERESEVLALKVTPNAVEERFIRCQDTEFWTRRAPLSAAASRKLAYERKNGLSDEQFYTSLEMTELYQFTKQYFYWRPGSYKLDFLLDAPERFNLKNDSYHFSLSHQQVSELATNRDNIEDAWQWTITNPEDKAGMPANWIYPELRRR
ncbi:hypothetical protein [Herbaspirillum sp. 1130]|uniref:hypothetical protein n=1 Tax=Herbaspirillum sp. 1130 TaxID=2806562 RepID=UPI001AEAD0F6|nr:hypothetical protein [Herbaspirillum sp. 1130]MBP1317108.1 hypothetical protein [Herbaspirillum sp. 1130]